MFRLFRAKVKLGSAVGQGELKTTTGEVCQTNLASTMLTLPGGSWGLYIRLKCSIQNTNSGALLKEYGGVGNIPAAYASLITLKTQGSGGMTICAEQRYITASGHDHWIFLMVAKKDYQQLNAKGESITIKKGDIISGYQAPDHPSANSPEAGQLDIPHPFNNYEPDNHEIIIIDNAELSEMVQRKTRTKSLLTVINKDYLIDDTKNPIYQPREIIKIDEYGDIPGEVIKTIKTPEWAKLLINADEITLKRQIVESLPTNFLFKKMRLK